MMDLENKILSDLWQGNIMPQEMLLNVENKELDRISSNLDHMHFVLAEKINDSIFEEFNKYELEHEKYHELISEEAFKLGFSLAVKIMSEAFQK